MIFGVLHTEPTMVIAFTKRTLDQIYNNNKTKLSEIRIRLVGSEIGLLHVVEHPVGYALFEAYLTKVHAAESLQFYQAVDKFDVMCSTISKQYNSIVKHREHLKHKKNKRKILTN